MFLSKGLTFFTCLIVLTTSAVGKIPPGAPWAKFASKPVYSRAIVPPLSGMNTITVPYIPKSPLFPKFVDPKIMISKKTDLLSNLFGGVGPFGPYSYPYPYPYPMGFRPFMPYVASGLPLYNAADEIQSVNSVGTSNKEDGSASYKRGIFGPFSSKPFGSMSPKFGPLSPFSELNTVPDYTMKGGLSRKRRSTDESSITKLRSIMDGGKPETKSLGPPPPYPTLAPISEESEDETSLFLKKFGGATAPKQYMPGMFSPFGSMVDPSMFIAKKSAFLDTLFKNLATSTPLPTSTEVSTTKSTIVPPDFWFPSSMIPSPIEYDEKVENFLDKLFETLKLNKTMLAKESPSTKSDFARSIESDEDATEAKIVRSIDDLSSINAAKDTIVNSILSELGGLKSNMVTTMNDLVAYQKATSPMSPKKSFKPFGPGMWPKSPVDGMLPFQQKMAILSQVFDMLSDLQRNITLAVQSAVNAKMASANVFTGAMGANYPSMNNDILSTTSNIPIDMSFLDAIKSKLGTFDYEMPASYGSGSGKFGPKMTRTMEKAPGSFWVSYPGDADAAEKRQIDSDTELLIKEESNSSPKQEPRGVQMQMHQGYQSLPPGSVESVQAGGGSTPGHQGGGIKLFDNSDYEDSNKWADWMEYLRNNHQGHRHHNHH
ncbi:uncharacterized protein LOC128894986 isoform X1 [Hylaeus anthracinus]|uniref:uncharacterized protein LOC128894986 isoform X1 n=1 Tax=Hylaeus anthracinus TaxID=313031 RepID=UPI0023B90DC2|nr:uncharacterized protein LOC128894986 isoform X1 [Hylaeus anthracinus]